MCWRYNIESARNHTFDKTNNRVSLATGTIWNRISRNLWKEDKRGIYLKNTVLGNDDLSQIDSGFFDILNMFVFFTVISTERWNLLRERERDFSILENFTKKRKAFLQHQKRGVFWNFEPTQDEVDCKDTENLICSIRYFH